MQTWTIEFNRTLDAWQVLHNDKPVKSYHTADLAAANALRRAQTSAQNHGVEVKQVDVFTWSVEGEPLNASQKQDARLARLKRAAIMCGYDTIDKLAAAILSGKAKIA